MIYWYRPLPFGHYGSLYFLYLVRTEVQPGLSVNIDLNGRFTVSRDQTDAYCSFFRFQILINKPPIKIPGMNVPIILGRGPSISTVSLAKIFSSLIGMMKTIAIKDENRKISSGITKKKQDC
jgi:hypothetical protein